MRGDLLGRFLLDRLAALAHERDDALNSCANAIGEAVERERDLLPHSPVLQAVLDAIKGTIDTSTNIADHPNVKFAQMERLKLEKRAEHAEAALLSLQTATQWQPIATAPKDREILVRCRNRAGLPGTVVAHYCDFVEDHPPIEAAWYFWNGGQFTPATQPTHWMPLPEFAALLPDPAGTPHA